MKRLFLFLAILFLLSVSAAASDKYVKSSCTNNGNGTSSACAGSPGGAGAWKLFSNISWGSIVAGDTLHLITGETYAPPLNIGSSGTAGNPVTVTVDGGGSATIDCAGTPGCAGINYTGHSYVTVDGVIGNKVAGLTTYGIKIINNASQSGLNGYCVYENNGGLFNKVLHVECSGATTAAMDDNGGGMFVDARGFEVGYNWVHSTTAGTRWLGTGITHFASTPSSTSYTDDLVHDNWVQDMQNDGIRIGSNTSMYNNVVSNIAGSGHSDSLLVQSGGYDAIYNNYVFGSGDQNIYLDNLYTSTCAHVRIYNNIINSNPGFGIVVDPEGGAGNAPGTLAACTGTGASKWDDVVITNNTFYSTSASSMRWSGRGQVTNLVFINNIFGTNTDSSYYNLNPGGTTTFASATAWDYNVYSTSSVHYPSVAAWTAVYTIAQLRALSPPRETNGKAGIPTYVNTAGADFHLSPTDTVAVGAGVNLTSTYSYLTLDKDGTARSAAGPWDLGAYTLGTTFSKCDINLDGIIDSSDISLLVNIIQGRVATSTGDVNTDGVKDPRDLQIVIAVVLGLRTCPP